MRQLFHSPPRVYDSGMSSVLDREEYIEQAYFFRVLRERMASNFATQEILAQVDQEILSTTRLPLAIQFLATELKHSGLLSSGFERLPHYFTPFQAFVIRQTEVENVRFSMETALLLLEREATYRAGEPTPQGVFIYQFEGCCRNRLGYEDGLRSIGSDPFYSPDWRDYADWIRRQVGLVEFADLIYLRSELFMQEQQRHRPEYVSPLPIMFGEKEGKIARANRGRDPLYLFAALQRQLNYPEVPRPKPLDDTNSQLVAVRAKLNELEARTRLLESEARGQVDLSQFAKPEILSNLPPDEED
jgi:hypothetical protein